jgi:hypothetical protein
MRELEYSSLASIRAYWLVAAFEHFWGYLSHSEDRTAFARTKLGKSRFFMCLVSYCGRRRENGGKPPV